MLQHALHDIFRVAGQGRFGIGILVHLDLKFAQHGVHGTDVYRKCLHLCLSAKDRVHVAGKGYNDPHGDRRETKDAGIFKRLYSASRYSA